MGENTKRQGVSAGIIIIGDEILKGHVQDTNSFYLCKQLWNLGIKVGKIATVADDLGDISAEVKVMSSRYDFVFTTGGVGPTHDDVTMEAVGNAFGDELAPHPDILKALGIDKNGENTSPWGKMAIVPKSTKVYVQNDDRDLSLLLMVVKNVYCYPGIPNLFRSIFQQYKYLYNISQTQFFLKEIFFSCDEDILAKPLSMVQSEYPSVQLGSYPNVSTTSNYCVKVSLESDDKEQVEMAYSRLIMSLGVDSMMSAKDNYSCSDKSVTEAREAVSWLLERLPSHQSTLLPGQLCQRLQKSIQILEDMLDIYNSFDEFCVAFNGGKDCTVILDLLHSILKKRQHDFTQTKLMVLFVEPHEPFTEAESFIEESISRYTLKVVRIKGSIHSALSDLKTSHSTLKAVCMGTRHTDPHSDKLESFSPTDSTWPDYMRVHCILEWSYSEVWLYLKLFKVPYCVLYDKGYTSLDGIKDTFPNPALLIDSSDIQNSVSSTGSFKTHTDKCSYLAAYMLTDEGLERAGRSLNIVV